jgi:small subunit ribosomal protein S9
MTETIWATGRRKTSIARVRAVSGSGRLFINSKSLDQYFAGHEKAKNAVMRPFQVAKNLAGYDFHITVGGGGTTGQSEAIRLGLSRAAVAMEPGLRQALRKEGFLTRDPRMVERKKPGQPKARRRFQFSKR